MKRFFISTIAILVCAAVCCAQTSRIFCISTGPGEDASTQAGVSWSTDTTVTSTSLVLALEADASWTDAVRCIPQQKELCTVFDGVWSDDAEGKETYEHAVSVKCGIMLDNLRRNSDYKYYIETDDGERSSVHHFRTAGASEWSACIISDFHSYPPLPGRLQSAMAMIDTVARKDPSLDWIFSPGDVVAWGGSWSFWKRLFEEKNFERYMWGRVNGNHDNWTKESQVTHDFDIPNDYFLGTSYFPRNSYEGELGVCYHFRYGNALFVMLNTEDMRKKGEFEAASAWTESVIARARKSDNPPLYVVVCMHYEWFLGTNGKTSQYGRWAEVFDRAGVDLAVAGNNHVYLRTLPLYDGNKTDGKKKGTVYLQTSSSDNGRGRKISETDFFNSELIENRWTEGSHTVSAIHMDVNDRRMVLTLLDREGNEIDSCRVYPKHRK